MKIVGILGGMGPEVSARFYTNLITLAQIKYKAVQDNDFPQIIINSLNMGGFDETGVKDKKKVLQQLKEGILMLNKAGCDFIVIPCNTVHCFFKELQKVSRVPILNLLEETAKKVKEKKVCLLASETTLQTGLYHPFLDYLTLKEKDYCFLNQLILSVMGGEVDLQVKEKIINLVNKLKVKAVILGCTELPLAFSKNDFDLKVHDSLQILVEATLDYAYKHQ